jgi:two-component system sensor histidine kinase UhpB
MDLDMDQSWKRSRPMGLSPASWLTLIYLVVSITWILTSDSVAIRMAGQNATFLQHLQQFKGLFFVSVSAMLLYSVSNRFYNNLVASFRQRENLEKKFEGLNYAAREAIFDCDLEKMTAELNEKMRFFFPTAGNRVENFWAGFQERIHPEDLQNIRKEYNEIAHTSRSLWQIEHRLLGADEKYYHVISSIYIIRNEHSQLPVRLIGTILDITDLRKLQIEKYEQRLRHKQELAASMIRVQESERDRWAQELHDNVCQLLTVANLYLGQMEKKPGTIPQLLPQARTLVGNSMAEIRQLSASIKPPSFELATLRESLEKLTADIARVKEIIFLLHIDDLEEMIFDEDQKLLVYRIVQEQLNNILKYAEASKVEIAVRLVDETVTIRVVDNGKGFDPLHARNGIGLGNIRSRLQLHKGTLEIQSEPGKGCTLLARFPYTGKRAS